MKKKYIAPTIDQKNLLLEIKKFASINKTTLSDAIVSYSEKKGLEIESVAEIVKSNIAFKQELKEEYEKLNLLPKRKTGKLTD